MYEIDQIRVCVSPLRHLQHFHRESLNTDPLDVCSYGRRNLQRYVTEPYLYSLGEWLGGQGSVPGEVFVEGLQSGSGGGHWEETGEVVVVD